ncbi:MAG: hypothetical protein U0J65_04240, partial [Christensenellales bacterium]|nr:hypothetical protein [Christensenellales bacterium]
MRPPQQIQQAKRLLDFFFSLLSSSFAPMEVQRRRPLCGIQAALNGSSPVATTTADPVSNMLAGFFLSPAFFIVRADGGSTPPPAVRDSGGFERFESCCDHQIKSSRQHGLFPVKQTMKKMASCCRIETTTGGHSHVKKVYESRASD